MELIAKLGIDWKLLLAQIVNFAILVGALTYFVYRPLLNLLDERRERIRKAMEGAKRIEEQKKEFDVFRGEQLKNVDQEVGAMLERGKAEAEKMRDEILAGAKRDAEGMLERGRRELQDERARVMNDLQSTIARMTIRLTEKLLLREFKKEDQERLMHELEKSIPTLVR